VHHLSVQALQLVEDQTHLPLQSACVNWVEALLDFKDDVLETSDGNIAIDVKLVSVDESLREEAEVSRLNLLGHVIACRPLLVILLSLDSVRDDLGLLSEDIECGVCQHRHLHIDCIHLLPGCLLHFLNRLICAFQCLLGEGKTIARLASQVLR